LEAVRRGQAWNVITYDTEMAAVTSADLEGFFDGWPTAPDATTLLRVLRQSALGIVARDADKVVGFVNALSDGELAVYIPLLEVRRSHRGRGIGGELVRRVLAHFENVYMVDAVCDPDVVPFYERLGMTRLAGMANRNRQSPVLSNARAD
jgi:ribosomal protein S18 acetylase RimI-like enzyme